MIYNSEGGFTFAEVYDMPTYLRSFYLRELVDQKKREDKEMKKMKAKSSAKTPSMPRR